ncbi:MAG: hypothetical protein Q7R79_02550, partial [bacterium]|nr:hypothetical protein [bacterium]
VKRSDGAGVEIRVPQQIIIESKIIEKSSEIKVGLPISQEEKKKRINIEREIIKKELIEPKIEKKKTTEEVEKAIRLLPETQSKDIYIEGAHIEILQSNMKLEEVIVIAKENNDIKKIIVGPNISHNEVIDFVAEKETSIHEYVQQKVLERVEEKFQEEEIDVTEQLRIQESVVEEIKKIELIRKTESRSKDEIYLIVSALPENSFDVYIQEKKISRTTPETDLSEAIVVVKKDTIIQNIFSSSTLSVERVVDVVLRKDISLRKEIQEKAKVRIEKIGDEEHNEEEQDTQRQKEDVIKKLKEEIRQKFEEKTSSETIKTLVRENDLQDVELYISGKKEVVTDQTNFTESILVLKEKNTKNIRKIVASIDINRDEFIELLISSDDDIKNKIQRIVETRIEKSADIEKKVNKDQRVYLESPQEIDLLKPEKIEEPIQLDVKPLTPDQAISWAGLKVPFGKRHMRGHLYLVTASRRIADIQVPISRFPNPLQYTFQYSDDDLIGVSEESLQVYSWDPEIGQPQLENSIVDPETNTIFASIDHLTIFTLAGQAISAGGAGSVGSTGLMEAVVEPEVTYIASVELEPTQTQVKGDDLGLFQTETDQKATFAANEFYTTPNTEFSLCIPLKLFKKPVKRVHLDVAGKKIPLKLDTKKGCYAASVKMSEKKGKQSIIVTIVYADGQIQTLKFQAVVTGKFQSEVLSVVAPAVQQVKEVAIIVNTQVQKTVEATQPVLQATAVVTAPIITVASPSVLTNTMNIWHYASHLFSSLITALGLRRRRKPWGVVYNAISKTPIDLAILRLFNASNNKLLETQVTDKNGRFSFLAPPGEYSITVTKPPFIYPSALVKTSTDGDYAHVYRRELLKITKPDEAIDLSIPLDPPSGEKGGTHEKETLLQQLKKIFSKYSTVYLILSLVVSFALAIYVPTTTNALLLIFNGVFTIIQVYLTQRVEKSWGVVFDMESGQQIPLAAISIIDALQNKLLRTRLTDYHGRFSFLPPPGEYILTVSKDQYLFPPITQKKSSKYKDVYIGGKLVIKKKKGFAKANIPMEKKAVVPTPPPQAPLPPSQALPVVPTTESPQQLEQKPPTTPT